LPSCQNAGPRRMGPRSRAQLRTRRGRRIMCAHSRATQRRRTPVRRSFSIPSLAFRNTGSSAFADDGSQGPGARFGPWHIRAPKILTDSNFKQPHVARHGFAISPRHAREVCLNFPSPCYRGRRECRAPNAPAASHARKKARERSHHGHTGNHPAFPAQWSYGVLRALPGDEFVLSPSLPDWRLAEPGRARFASGSLAPATGVRTTRLGRTRKAPVILRAALRSRGSSRPAIAFSRLTPSRPPHPAPRP
jgi:hypothetical protein